MKSLFAATLVLLCVGAACSTDEASATTVVATDTKCTPEKTNFDAGKVTFAAKNEGGKVTELRALLRLDTPQEALYFLHGGILNYVLRQLRDRE